MAEGPRRRALAAWSSVARLELGRTAGAGPLLVAAALALWLGLREPRSAGAVLAARLLEPDPATLPAQDRARALGLGLALVALLWLVGLARAQRRAAGAERALWAGAPLGALARAAARWTGRVVGAGLLAVPIAVAAEAAAGAAPVRPLLAALRHPGAALVGERQAAALALPDLRDGRLRVELSVVPGAGPASRARLRLARAAGEGHAPDGSAPDHVPKGSGPNDAVPGRAVPSEATEELRSFSGRRGFELAVPPGAGELRLLLVRPDGAAPWWLASDSMLWIGERSRGALASSVAWLEFVAAAGLAAALWPLLRRRLDGPIAVGLLAMPWLAAWLGGAHGALLPGGPFPALLDELGAALVPARAPLRLVVGLALAGAALALQAWLVERHGEELRE